MRASAVRARRQPDEALRGSCPRRAVRAPSTAAVASRLGEVAGLPGQRVPRRKARRERTRGEERGRAKGDPNGPPAAPPLLLTVRPLSPPSSPPGPVPERGRPEPSEPAPPGSTIRAGDPGLRVLSPVLAVPAEAAGWELGGGIAAPAGPRAPAGRDAARGWLRRGLDRAASVSAPSKLLWSPHRRRHQLTPARGSGTAGSRNLSRRHGRFWGPP